MPLTKDFAFIFYAGVACILATLSYFYSSGNAALAILPIAAFACWHLLPLLKKATDIQIVAGIIFVFLILDIPTNFPFYEFDPLTERLGFLLFEAFSKTFGISGLRLTGLEIISYGTALWLAFRNQRHELENLRYSPTFQFTFFMALLIPAIGALFTVVGVLKGNDIGLALTQVRFLPIVGCWTYIGYVSCRHYEDGLLILKVFIVTMTVKALQGLYAYWWVFERHMGQREYIIEHLASDYMATALLSLGALLFMQDKRRSVIAILITFGVILLPYILNDRRASFIGVAISLLLSPALLKPYVRKKHVVALGLASMMFIAYIAATWNNVGAAGTFARTIQSLVMRDEAAEPDYRELENYNLYQAAFQNPLTGMGFGKRFAMVADMPNIGDIYQSFDLVPHNNMLFVYAYSGPLGMAALGTFVTLAVAVMVRLHKRRPHPAATLFAFIGFTVLVRWMIFVFADIGLLESRTTAIVGLFVGMGISMLRGSMGQETLPYES